MNPTTVRELEAEIDRLRAELANVHHNAEMWYAEKLRAEAELAVKDEVALGIMAALVKRNDAIARVRELCEARVGWMDGAAYRDVLRALDGDTE